MQALAEARVLTVEAVGLARGKVVLGRVGLVGRRIIDRLVGPGAGHRDDPAVGLAEVGEILPPDVGGVFAPFAIAMLVDDQHAPRVRGRRRIGSQQRQPPRVDRSHGPGRFRQEPLERLRPRVLHADGRHRIRQTRRGLAALGGQEQPLQVAPETLSLAALGEEVVKPGGVVLRWRGSGGCGQALRHGDTSAAHESTDDAAERALRHFVTGRKISGGTRSQEGTETKMALATLFGTWYAEGCNPLIVCR